MKRAVFLIAILFFTSFLVVAEESAPITLEAILSFGSGFGISTGYAISLGNMSLEPNLAAIFFGTGGSLVLQAGIRYYPFNAYGNGFFMGADYSISPMHDLLHQGVSALAGYRFNFFNFMTAHLGIGGRMDWLSDGRTEYKLGGNFGIGIRL